jgi:hypothetical protein
MRIKKELLEVVLVFMLGVLFILVLAWNVNQYDKKFPNQNINIQTE